jgi:2-dehydropantoate 2-reductase
MNICVLGCGAMGSIYAGLFCAAGNRVSVVGRHRAHMQAIQQHGLRISGASGDRTVNPIVRETVPDEDVDLLIIAVKASAVAEAAQACVDKLDRISTLLTIQNGLGSADIVAEILDSDRLLVGIAQGFGASLVAPGHAHHNDMKAIRLGSHTAEASHLSEPTAALWRDAGFDAAAVEDILAAQWEKLICNVAYSAPCAITGMTVGEAMEDSALGPLTQEAAREACDIARALKIPLSFDDPVAYVRAFASRMPNAKPSVLLDIESGKPSEVGVINGSIPLQAARIGRDAPVNAALTALVRAIENRRARKTTGD